MENQELDLHEALFVLRRRLLLIIAMPAVAAVVAALVSQYALTPVYKASTTLWVIKQDAGQISYNDLMLNRNLVKTYAEVARSRAVMADVIDRLGLEATAVEQLQKRLTVAPVRDTEILSFTVTDVDPAMAARLADAVAAAFQGQIRTFMKVENVVVVDPALVPTAPFKPRIALNTAAALLLGLMAAVGLSFLAAYLDTSIRSPEDVARYLDLPVLAVIPTFSVTLQPEPKPGQRQAADEGRVEA